MGRKNIALIAVVIALGLLVVAIMPPRHGDRPVVSVPLEHPGQVQAVASSSLYTNNEFGFSVSYPNEQSALQILVDPDVSLNYSMVGETPSWIALYHDPSHFLSHVYNPHTDDNALLAYDASLKRWEVTGDEATAAMCPVKGTDRGATYYEMSDGFHAGDTYLAYLVPRGMIVVSGPAEPKDITVTDPGSTENIGCTVTDTIAPATTISPTSSVGLAFTPALVEALIPSSSYQNDDQSSTQCTLSESDDIDCTAMINPHLPGFRFHFVGDTDKGFGGIQVFEGSSTAVLQTLPYNDDGTQGGVNWDHILGTEDVNFDGYQDVALTVWQDQMTNSGVYFVYDPAVNRFVEDAFLTQNGPFYEFYPEQKIVESINPGGQAILWSEDSYYLVLNGSYLLIKQIEYNETSTQTFELDRGTMVLTDTTGTIYTGGQ